MKSLASSVALSLFSGLAIASHVSAIPLNTAPQPENEVSAPYPLLSQSLLPMPALGKYQQAKAELPEDFYLLYRVVDRLSRANALDNHPWRITVSADYEANAFAQKAPNQLALYGGLVDQLHGDIDALACVVGHEMAHHSERHEALGAAERDRIDQKLKEEAIAQAQGEIANNRPRSTGANAVRVLGGLFGGWARVGGAVAGSVLGRGQQNSQAKLEARAEELYVAKRAQQDEQWRELDHQQDFAADQLGYKYAVQAGFERTGCLRAMTVLGDLGVEAGTSHPTSSVRSQKLLSAPTQYPTVGLMKAGKAQLADSAVPLSYRFTSNPEQLEINSRFSEGDIDSRFPQ